MNYVSETIRIPLWKHLQLCLQSTKNLIENASRTQEKSSKRKDTMKIRNEKSENQNCKPMISSLYGLENKIRNKENVEDISKLGNSFHIEAASFLTLDHCNDHQLEELKQLSGNK